MSAWSPHVHINRSTKHHYGYINIEDIYQPRELSAAGAEETAKIWGGGGGNMLPGHICMEKNPME